MILKDQPLDDGGLLEEATPPFLWNDRVHLNLKPENIVHPKCSPKVQEVKFLLKWNSFSKFQGSGYISLDIHPRNSSPLKNGAWIGRRSFPIEFWSLFRGELLNFGTGGYFQEVSSIYFLLLEANLLKNVCRVADLTPHPVHLLQEIPEVHSTQLWRGGMLWDDLGFSASKWYENHGKHSIAFIYLRVSCHIEHIHRYMLYVSDLAHVS